MIFIITLFLGINMRSLIYLFTFIVTISLTGCMYYGSSLTFRIKTVTVNKSNLVSFLIDFNSFFEKYSIKSVRVEKTRELCSLPVAKPPSVLLWSLYPKKRISISTDIVYGIGGNTASPLNRNTLYTVKIVIQNNKNKSVLHGMGIFVINSQGRVFSASTYPEIQSLCGKYQ